MNTPLHSFTAVISTLFAILIVSTFQPVLASQGQSRVESDNPAELIYLDTSASPAITGYTNVQGSTVPALAPEIIYADQAYGQAIFSYPHVAAFVSTAFNAEYVDTAFGQAIYSYPSAGAKTGVVTVLDILPLQSKP